ncbi:sensor of ECF-type sigma factor [Dokdonia sinensis]|uniref:Sensor of ECF-type sigma factor n=1 Tax=Dokdonia sinensis TaxID=2479847 RepID=A0A3M0G848_9FLAO|nr:sensor of ECF-type sigma factor [Dokdonia sinensis]RMB61084.1 sensor of ECF-type sigma factor [Dokdonia sinensis]
MKLKMLILAVFITASLAAQEDRKEKIKALKVAHISQELELTPKQAQEFWPIYNVYEAKMDKIRDTERTMMRSLKEDWEQLSETQAKDALRTILKADQDKNSARETLITQLKNTLSSKKTLVLLKAEEDFKRKLIKQLRGDRKGSRPDRN